MKIINLDSYGCEKNGAFVCLKAEIKKGYPGFGDSGGPLMVDENGR